MKIELIPKFREVDLYIIALSIIIFVLLYIDIPSASTYLANFFISAMSKDIIGALKEIIVTIILFFYITYYLVILPLFFAFSEKVPSRTDAEGMVHCALLFLSFLSLFGAAIWYAELAISPSPIDRMLIIFPLFGIIKSVSIIFMIRAGLINYATKFEYKNTDRTQLSIAAASVIVIGTLAKFLTSYHPVLTLLMMIDIPSLLVNALRPET